MLTDNERAWLENRKEKRTCGGCIVKKLDGDAEYRDFAFRNFNRFNGEPAYWKCAGCKFNTGFAKGDHDNWEAPEWWERTRKNKWPCMFRLTKEGEQAHKKRRDHECRIRSGNFHDAAEFSERVAKKLAEIFDGSTEIAPLCPSCPCEDDCYAGKLKCKAAILKYARLQVEEEMENEG